MRDNGGLDGDLSVGDGEKGTDSESTREVELTGAAGVKQNKKSRRFQVLGLSNWVPGGTIY